MATNYEITVTSSKYLDRRTIAELELSLSRKLDKIDHSEYFSYEIMNDHDYIRISFNLGYTRLTEYTPITITFEYSDKNLYLKHDSWENIRNMFKDNWIDNPIYHYCMYLVKLNEVKISLDHSLQAMFCLYLMLRDFTNFKFNLTANTIKTDNEELSKYLE